MEKTATLPRPKERTERRVEHPRLWNVVLLDDQAHSYDYVIEMMQKVFGHPLEKAYKVAKTVDSDGRAVCKTAHRELAELKVEQVRCYGADPLIAGSTTSMRAIIEPAECGGDDNDPPGGDGR